MYALACGRTREAMVLRTCPEVPCSVALYTWPVISFELVDSESRQKLPWFIVQVTEGWLRETSSNYLSQRCTTLHSFLWKAVVLCMPRWTFRSWLRDCNIQNSQTLLDFGFEWSFPNFSPLVLNHGFTFKSLEEFLNNIGAQSGPGIWKYIFFSPCRWF